MAHWRMVRPLLEPAVKEMGGYSLEDVAKMIFQQKWLLWTLREELPQDGQLEGIVVGEVAQFPTCREIHIRICAGRNMERWVHHIAGIEQFAQSNGCSKVQALARPGWWPILKGLGYSRTHVLIEKHLGNTVAEIPH